MNRHSLGHLLIVDAVLSLGHIFMADAVFGTDAVFSREAFWNSLLVGACLVVLSLCCGACAVYSQNGFLEYPTPWGHLLTVDAVLWDGRRVRKGHIL